jgi:hypothetical protein
MALLAATAMADVIVGPNAQLLIGASIGGAFLAGGATWIRFLAGLVPFC